jgi:hypothetical protein
MDALVLSLAYKFVVFSLMLSNVNSFCGRAGLPLEHPLTMVDIRQGSHVGPSFSNAISGSILSDKYFFGFGRGQLANYWRNDFKPKTDEAIQARNTQLAKQRSLVDTNGAYQVATNWLVALGVDVSALEPEYRRQIIQWRYYPEGPDGRTVPLPIFQVQWLGKIRRNSTREMPVVTVTVLGTTQEIVEHHVLDEKLFRTSPVRIDERERLLSIPDSEFKSYTALQQSNLLAQFGRTNGSRATTNAPAESRIK